MGRERKRRGGWEGIIEGKKVSEEKGGEEKRDRRPVHFSLPSAAYA